MVFDDKAEKILYNQKRFGEIPKRLKGLAWKASRRVTLREGSNPSFSAMKWIFVKKWPEKPLFFCFGEILIQFLIPFALCFPQFDCCPSGFDWNSR